MTFILLRDETRKHRMSGFRTGIIQDGDPSDGMWCPLACNNREYFSLVCYETTPANMRHYLKYTKEMFADREPSEVDEEAEKKKFKAETDAFLKRMGLKPTA